MNRRTSLLAVVALCLAAGTVYSSTSSATADGAAPAREIADRLARGLNDGDFDAFKMEIWKASVDESVVGNLGEQLDGGYKQLTDALGVRSKVELMKAETAGPSVARFTYAEFHTRGVVVWKFEFFKPADDWKLHAYQFGPLRMESAGLFVEGQ